MEKLFTFKPQSPDLQIIYKWYFESNTNVTQSVKTRFCRYTRIFIYYITERERAFSFHLTHYSCFKPHKSKPIHIRKCYCT